MSITYTNIRKRRNHMGNNKVNKVRRDYPDLVVISLAEMTERFKCKYGEDSDNAQCHISAHAAKRKKFSSEYQCVITRDKTYDHYDGSNRFRHDRMLRCWRSKSVKQYYTKLSRQVTKKKGDIENLLYKKVTVKRQDVSSKFSAPLNMDLILKNAVERRMNDLGVKLVASGYVTAGAVDCVVIYDVVQEQAYYVIDRSGTGMHAAILAALELIEAGTI